MLITHTRSDSMKKRDLTIATIIGMAIIIGYMFVPQKITSEVKLDVFKSLESIEDLSNIDNLNMEIIHRKGMSQEEKTYETTNIDKIEAVVDFLGNYKCMTDFNQLRKVNNMESYNIKVMTGNETFFFINLCREYLSITSKMHPSGPKFIVVGKDIDFRFLEKLVQSLE